MIILFLMTKKRIIIKAPKLKVFFKKGGRKDAKNDFLELLKRASKPVQKK